MRKLLYFAAINVVKSHGIMHERYQKMLDRGMPKMKAGPLLKMHSGKADMPFWSMKARHCWHYMMPLFPQIVWLRMQRRLFELLRE